MAVEARKPVNSNSGPLTRLKLKAALKRSAEFSPAQRAAALAAAGVISASTITAVTAKLAKSQNK